MVKVEITKLECSKCGHVWTPEDWEVHECPVCKCALSKYPPKKIKPPSVRKKAEGSRKKF